jgi:hypothetical protein
MTDVRTPDRSDGLPDKLFHLDSDESLEGGYAAVAVMEAPAAASAVVGGNLTNGDPPAWMLWGVDE